MSEQNPCSKSARSELRQVDQQLGVARAVVPHPRADFHADRCPGNRTIRNNRLRSRCHLPLLVLYDGRPVKTHRRIRDGLLVTLFAPRRATAAPDCSLRRASGGCAAAERFTPPMRCPTCTFGGARPPVPSSSFRRNFMTQKLSPQKFDREARALVGRRVRQMSGRTDETRRASECSGSLVPSPGRPNRHLRR